MTAVGYPPFLESNWRPRSPATIEKGAPSKGKIRVEPPGLTAEWLVQFLPIREHLEGRSGSGTYRPLPRTSSIPLSRYQYGDSSLSLVRRQILI